MRKIPSLFVRKQSGDRTYTDEVTPGCGWVLNGEGVPTRKWDGTCCMVQDHVLYKRREIKRGNDMPADFIEADYDANTGKIFGWMPVGDGPDDRYHRQAWSEYYQACALDGTYELCGPKINGNREKFREHVLLVHGGALLFDIPRTYDELRKKLESLDIEGVVFWHKDGRRAKVTKKGFGMQREPVQ